MSIAIRKKPALLFSAAALLLLLAFFADPAVRSLFLPPFPYWGKAIMEGASYLGKGWRLILLSTALLGLGILLQKQRLKDAGEMCLYTLAASTLVVHLTKHLFGRPRPRLFDKGLAEWGASLLAGIQGFDSFPSGHATSTFAVATICARAYPRARVLFYGGASVVAFSRVYLGSHFLSDVVAGLILGLLVGHLMFTFSPRILAFTERLETQRGVVSAGMVLTLAGLVFFYRLDAVGLFDGDEAAFAETTREMMETNNPIVPLYNFTNRYDRPILFYWLMATAFALFGINEFAARFWSALAGSGLVLLTFLFARSVIGSRCAVLSALILATNLESLILSRLAVSDMVLTFFIAAALYFFYMAIHEPASRQRRPTWALWGWAAAAAAVLTEGPMGILFPASIIAGFLWLCGRIKEGTRQLRPGLGAALFCLIILPLYVAASFLTQGEFLKVFFLEHNVMRYLVVNSGHGGPLFYYLVVIALGFFPWSAFLPAALRSAWTLRGSIKAPDPNQKLPVFLLLWIVVIFLFLSVSRTKLPNYLAPLLPALSLLVGWWWDRFLSEREETRTARFAAVLGAILGLIFTTAFIILSVGLNHLQQRFAYVPYLTVPWDLGMNPLLLSGATAFATGGFFLLLKKSRAAESFATLVAAMVLLSLVLVGA